MGRLPKHGHFTKFLVPNIGPQCIWYTSGCPIGEQDSPSTVLLECSQSVFVQKLVPLIIYGRLKIAGSTPYHHIAFSTSMHRQLLYLLSYLLLARFVKILMGEITSVTIRRFLRRWHQLFSSGRAYGTNGYTSVSIIPPTKSWTSRYPIAV